MSCTYLLLKIIPSSYSLRLIALGTINIQRIFLNCINLKLLVRILFIFLSLPYVSIINFGLNKLSHNNLIFGHVHISNKLANVSPEGATSQNVPLPINVMRWRHRLPSLGYLVPFLTRAEELSPNNYIGPGDLYLSVNPLALLRGGASDRTLYSTDSSPASPTRITVTSV